ncbi:hypothetical protein QPK14_14585 [Photorhabdus temperata subsp. temperata]
MLASFFLFLTIPAEVLCNSIVPLGRMIFGREDRTHLLEKLDMPDGMTFIYSHFNIAGYSIIINFLNNLVEVVSLK